MHGTDAADLPELPPAYQWEMVHQCQTFPHNQRINGKWIVRISWTMRNGKRRMLPLAKHYFPSKQTALAFGVGLANAHAEKHARRVAAHWGGDLRSDVSP